MLGACEAFFVNSPSAGRRIRSVFCILPFAFRRFPAPLPDLDRMSASAASTLPHTPIPPGTPATVLAPMQDVTGLGFINTIGALGAPTWFVTEFFRVHESSRLEKHILAS